VALHGVPVTTIDLEVYPASDSFRISRDRDRLRLNFSTVFDEAWDW
jgi:hypothetical protein